MSRSYFEGTLVRLRPMEPEDLDPDKGKTPGDILDELTGQMKLF